MLYEIYTLLTCLLKYDQWYHTSRRLLTSVKVASHFGVALIEYGRMKSEVIWSPQTSPFYLEEIIKINNNDFTSNVKKSI